jgi:hypothetical protein
VRQSPPGGLAPRGGGNGHRADGRPVPADTVVRRFFAGWDFELDLELARP